MFDLAQFSDGKPISLSVVAKRQKLPLNYLEQIMLDLKRSGLVKSVRGAYGGYQLSRDKEDITVKEIFDVLEGPVIISDCLENSDECDQSNYCATRLIYKKLSDKLDEVIDGITLKDMIEDKKRLIEENDLKIDL